MPMNCSAYLLLDGVVTIGYRFHTVTVRAELTHGRGRRSSRKRRGQQMQFISRRLAFYAVAAWFAVTINFVIPHLFPSNPVQAMMASHPNFPPSAVKALDIQFGLGHQGSLLHQYFVYLGHLAHGNLGISVLNYPETVTSVLGTTIPWTLALVGGATILSFVIGTLLGVLAGWRRGGWFDRLLPAFTFVQAIPYFFLALVVIQLASTTWHLFPAYGGYQLGDTIGFNATFIGSAFSHSVLPAFTIIVTSMAGWMLQMRNVMITTIGEDYVLAAQAKGLSTRRIMFTYAARNAILPNIAGFALAIGFVIGGALVMEIVFSYPGVGYQLYQAVNNADFPVMQGIFLAIAAAVLLACLLADIVYVIADPRTRRRAAY
jgi:peptide/nickel transport system permease protein